jgi:hypothetical protein
MKLFLFDMIFGESVVRGLVAVNDLQISVVTPLVSISGFEEMFVEMQECRNVGMSTYREDPASKNESVIE